MENEIDDFYMEPYDCNDPANEPRPDNVVYTASFRELQALNKKAASLLRDPLENSTFQNGITKGLVKEIIKRTKDDFPDQVKFAIVGDMSAGEHVHRSRCKNDADRLTGKSSLLNSILSIGTIARKVGCSQPMTCTSADKNKGDGGDSCTWVVQRYQKMFPEQSSPFAAKVRFFNRDEIRNTLGDLLAKYYRAANKEVKDEEDCDGENEDYTRVESYGDMRDTITAFTALFCEHVEFATEEAAHPFLKQAKSENDRRILNTLVEWADSLVEEYLGEKTALLIENSTPDRLLWDLQPFTYQIGGPEGQGVVAPWPLVSAIDFGLEHPLLNEGIVFVDSPGLSDTNSSRSKNAILSHRECTHKIIVAEIGRAEAAEAVRKNLQAGSRTRGSSNMLLVLTRGDSIDPKTDVSGTPIEKKRLDRLDIEIEQLQTQKKQKQQERRRAKAEDRDDLAEEIQSISLDIRKLSAEMESCRLEMRNRKVVIKMQEMYKGLTSDPKQLATFAVGNQAYQQHAAGFSDDDRPHISVKQTNIPALRHKLYMMPIQGRLNDTMHLAETQLPNLVNTMELYCAQLHLAQKSEIEAMVLAPKKLLPAVIHDSFEALKIQVLDTILTPIKEEESEWIKQARKCCRNWTEEFNGQLIILKGEGRKKAQRGKNAVNWNHELLEIHGDCLETFFVHFHRKLVTGSWSKDLTGHLVDLCDDTRRKIKRKQSGKQQEAST